MAEGFDFMKFAGDVGKGMCDVASGVGKGVCDVAGVAAGAADAACGAVVSAVIELTRPAAQYGKNMREGNDVAEWMICVCRVGGKDYKGRELPEKDQLIRVSGDGIELLASQDTSSGVAKKLSVRNCAVYANGKARPSGNPLFNAAVGGYGGAVAGNAVDPVLAPVGVAAGIAAAFKRKDVWYIDILEYAGTEWTFRLRQRSDGDDLIEFLDTHYAL